MILPRSAWGAAPASASPQPWGPGGPVDLVVHWVGGKGTLNIDSHDDCPSRIRNVQAYEMSHGYTDIAYNLALCPHGQVYEARGLTVRGAANGPATNGTKPSVCLLLNERDPMTTAMQDALLDLNLTVTPGTIYGHREVNSTTCPGDQVYAWIVGHRHATPPVPIPKPITEDDVQRLVKCNNGDPMVLITNSIHSRWVQDEQELNDLTGLYGPLQTWAPRDFYRPVLVGPAPGAPFAGRPPGWPTR